MDRPRVTDEDRTSEPQVTLIRQVFSLVCRVEVNIRATAPAIWHILSDAKGFPRWNSTITRIDGTFVTASDCGFTSPGPIERSRRVCRASCRASE